MIKIWKFRVGIQDQRVRDDVRIITTHLGQFQSPRIHHQEYSNFSFKIRFCQGDRMRGIMLMIGVSVVGLVGCGKQTSDTAPVTPPTSTTNNPIFPGINGSQPATTPEDPDVAAYLQKKGWRITQDFRISDLKPMNFLAIQNAAKPFDTVSLDPKDYEILGKVRSAQVLDLRNVNTTDDGLKALCVNQSIEAIIVKGEDLTDTGIKELAQAKNLNNITLFGNDHISDVGVEALAALPKLESLYLGFIKITGSCFAKFAKPGRLTSLTIEYCSDLTDAGAEQIAGFANLQGLKITKAFSESKLTSAGIRAIVANILPHKFEFDKTLLDDDLLKVLLAKGWLYGPTPAGITEKKPATAADVRSINLERSKVTDAGFQLLRDCVNTESLFLEATQLTDASFHAMKDWSRIKYLSLNKTKITAAGLAALQDAPIEHIALEYATMTEETFQIFGKFPQLKELWISDTKFDPTWFKHLSGLKKLRDLGVRQTAFNDAAADAIAGLPELASLALNSTAITDTGFDRLLQLPKLTSVSLYGTKVSKEAIANGKKKHPKAFFSH
jgi:hypothetical protein